MKQLSFLPKIPREHGGALSKGKRKTARPIVTKRPLHLVLRSSRACGAWSFLRPANYAKISQLLETLADRYKVKIYSSANVGNHIHLVVSVKRRDALKAFMRVLTQAIMFAVTGAKKGAPQGSFWDATYYSRIASWGREFAQLKIYLTKNKIESFGFSRPWIDTMLKHPLNQGL